MTDRDAWLVKQQPTPELCRMFHGIDCQRCPVTRVRKLPRLPLIEEYWV